MAFEHKEMTGSLFKNSYKTEGDNKPDYKGTCLIEGKHWDMAAWLKKTDKGVSLMTFKFSPPFKKDEGPKPPPVPPAAGYESRPKSDSDNSDVPF